MALLNFNANEVQPSRNQEPIPAGKYIAVITDSQERCTKSGTGTYIALTFEIIDGEYKGRKVFTNLNIHNPNKQAEEIARADLSAICRAVNVMTPNDSIELHNLPLTILVRQTKNNQTGAMVNDIRGYSPREDLIVAQKATPQAQTSTPPWER